MPTRRFLIISSLAATALFAGGLAASIRRRSGDPPELAAEPVDAAPAPGPSDTARCLAKHLQASLPQAKLDDSMTEKIAGDIDGFLDASKSFRNRGLRNSDEPDFVFSAVAGLTS